jgi:hypothetical protein
MQQKFFIALFLFLLIGKSKAQEFYPHFESANTQPVKSFSLKLSYENYKELPSQRTRNYNVLKFTYGLSARFTPHIAITASNHHPATFPEDISSFFKFHHSRNYPDNPYQLEGIITGLKFRAINIDRKQKHIRLALFTNVAKSFIAHTEAEPQLGDNTGAEPGIIGSILYKRFAITIMNGYIFPTKYKNNTITFQSGNAQYLNIGLGFRLYPKKYTAYDNLNVNIYFECINKQYGAASMTVNDSLYSFEDFKNYDPYIYNGLQANSYTELKSSVQFIFFTDTFINVGISHALRNNSYLHFYPLISISLQKYFF